MPIKTWREIGVDAPVVTLVGIGKRGARHLPAKAPVIEFAAHRSEARFDVTKAFAIRELSKTHRQKLIPTRETLLLVVAAIAGYTLLELISRKVVHELRENCLAKVHPSLSAIDTAWPRPPPGAIFDQKKFKSKNSKTLLNFHPIRTLGGIENSCPGQQ